ncbi:hypothetical protein V6X73_09360 [Spiribacter sp. 390]|uniref:Uncharacterized protein n=1 Tax=Spiribacter pallidus TaxID=1987936 RepID=A0ABV3TE79_9GAMM
MYQNTELLDLMREIIEEFNEDDEIADSILDDLSEAIEILLYERRATTSQMDVPVNDIDF